MTAELWQRLRPLYRAALGLSGKDRALYVNRVCSDDEELRGALVSLLEATDKENTGRDSHFADLKVLSKESPPTSFAPGELILDRFRIVRFVGRGGMGEVYEALDLEMGRIALKTIRPEIACNAEILMRFKREVQLALKISDPNVCRIHALYMPPNQVKSCERVFLTMEFLEGMSLSARLRKSGPLRWKEAKPIFLGICHGLQAIHRAGILHRDLKSDNIILTTRSGSPCAVLTDFGLAHEFQTADGSTATDIRLTSAGAVVGTPNYMAPEQFASDTLTPAADIFSLGVVMYEQVTGANPFPSSTTLQAAVQRGRRPAAPSSVQRGLPRRLDEVICRCLEFDPKRRYQSVRDLADDLENRLLSAATLRRTWPRALTGSISVVVLAFLLMLVPAIRERTQGILLSNREKHIAILPFDAATADPQTQALADGFMDAIAGRLANLNSGNPTLWVVPPSELRTRKVTDASTAWRDFGVTIVVEGRFTRDNGTTHLGLTLIDPHKMKEIGFSELSSADGTPGALEDEAVTRLGRLMNLSLTDAPDNDTGLRRGAAYQDYLTGLGYMQRYDKPGNLDSAIASFQYAVDSDQTFAVGFAELGEAYRLKYELGRDTQWLALAQANCEKAIQLNNGMASPHVTLARIDALRGQRDLAVQEFQRAIDVDPRDATAINGQAHLYEENGNNTLAEEAFKRAASLRPDYWDSYDELANFYERHKKFASAIREYENALSLTPDSPQVYANLGMVYIDQGDPKQYRKAEEFLRKSVAIAPTYNALANLGVLYGNEGRYAEYAAMTKQALQIDDKDWRVWANLVSAYEWLKDANDAEVTYRNLQERLEEAVKLRPQDADAQSSLAIVYAHEGLKASAMRRISTALALTVNDPEVLSNIADAYELLGDHQRTLEYLRRARRKGLTREDIEQDPYLHNLANG